jgi:O-antigen ligase
LRHLTEGFDGERGRFYVLVGFLVLCALGGGGSRADVLSLVFLWPACVLCATIMLALPGAWDFRGVRVPLALLAGYALVIAAQLIPLPPDMWTALPGHARFAQAAEAAGMAQPWRPISLTPDLTINALMALLPAATVLIGLAGTAPSRRRTLLFVVIAIACASMLLGVVQLSGSPHGPAYLYRITHNGVAVGLFANRNHQAAFLACCLPLLRLWTLMPQPHRELRRLRLWSALGIGALMTAMILITGSRAGIVLGGLGIAIAYFIAPLPRDPEAAWWKRAVHHLAWILPVILAFVVLFFGRALSVERLSLLQDPSAEQRIANAPLTLRMATDFFPFGSGFGSFDPVFRVYEPDSALAMTYFNHAHNDLVELILSGGAPAAILLLLLLAWVLKSTFQSFRPYHWRSTASLAARGGGAIVLLLMLGSLVDYPLRTPFLSAIFALACGWLAQRHSSGHPGRVDAPGQAGRVAFE